MSEILQATSTPYDDAFKTVVYQASRFVIPFINEVFGKSYALDEVVHFENTEFIDFISGNQQKKTRADAVFTIGDDETRYHIECQTVSDSTIVIRIFEYATHIARVHYQEVDGKTIFRFPDSAIFYLRNSSQIPEKFHPARLEFSDGSGIDFKIPVIRMFDYTLESLFEKNLYLMLPFYLFNLEKVVKKKKGNDEAKAIVFETVQTIINKLEQDEQNSMITSLECGCLKEMISLVGKNLMHSYPTIAEGVEHMGGQVLETQTYKAYERGIAEGEARGRAEGEARGRAEGEARGRAEGEARGRAEGEVRGAKKYSQLIAKLMAEKLYDEVTRISSDDDYREALYAAYGIA